MSWSYSRALVAEYSVACCSDTGQSAPSNGSPMPHLFCAPDKMTAFSRLSRFGMTFEPLTESRGEALLMWYREGFRAKTSVQQERVGASRPAAADCGKKWHESSARFCLDSYSWKTHRCLWVEELPWSSVILPRWGMTRNGLVLQHPTSERPISATVSGLWPTPSATDGQRGGVMTDNMTGQSLTQMVNTPKYWPTPCATDHKGAGKSGALRDRLDYAVERGATKSNIYATPQARDFRTGQTSRWEDPDRSRNLNDQIGGQLNPTWVEWLMGFPLGWTDLKPLETAKCQEWQQQHGEF